MNHFSTKTKAASKVVNDMRVILQKFKGDTSEQSARLDILQDLINYTIAIEVELNDTQEQLARVIFKFGEAVSERKDMEQKLYISEQIHEKGVDETIKQLNERLNEQL